MIVGFAYEMTMITSGMRGNAGPFGKQRRVQRHDGRSSVRTYRRDTGSGLRLEWYRRDGVTKCGCRISCLREVSAEVTSPRDSFGGNNVDA
jgi:hypothetical protein